MTPDVVRTIALVVPLSLAGCIDLDLDLDFDGCGVDDACGQDERLAFVVSQNDPVLGMDARPLVPIAVDGEADVGVLEVESDWAPGTIADASIEPSDHFAFVITEDRSTVAIRALAPASARLRITTADGVEDHIEIRAEIPVDFQVQVAEPPLLTQHEWIAENEAEGFAYAAGAQIDATLVPIGEGAVQLAGFGFADWAAIDPGLATAEPVARSNGLRIEVAPDLEQAEVLALESSTDAALALPIRPLSDVESVDWLENFGPAPDDHEMRVGDSLALMAVGLDPLGYVIIPGPEHRLQLEDAPDSLSIEEVGTLDALLVEAVAPGEHTLVLTYLGFERTIELTILAEDAP